MRLRLVDSVREQSADRIVADHLVSPDDDYLEDHFAGFPVLPGVLMLETMVRAARRLIARRDPAFGRHVLAAVRALKYGAMVRPGQTLVVEVALLKETEPGVFDFKGVGTVRAEDGADDKPRTAVSGRFTLRPIRKG